MEERELAEMKGELKKQFSQLAKYDLLIIDEVGYLPMTRQARYHSLTVECDQSMVGNTMVAGEGFIPAVAV